MSEAAHLTAFILFLSSYVFYYLGTTYPVVHIAGSSIDLPEIPFTDETRTIYQSLQELWSTSYYFPFFLILFFSIVVPLAKLIIALIAFFVSFKTKNKKKSMQLSLKLLGFLRRISKYQLVDVYLVIFMIAFLNINVIHTQPLSGATFFLIYCVLSIIATQILYFTVQSTWKKEVSELMALAEKCKFAQSDKIIMKEAIASKKNLKTSKKEHVDSATDQGNFKEENASNDVKLIMRKSKKDINFIETNESFENLKTDSSKIQSFDTLKCSSKTKNIILPKTQIDINNNKSDGHSSKSDLRNNEEITIIPMEGTVNSLSDDKYCIKKNNIQNSDFMHNNNKLINQINENVDSTKINNDMSNDFLFIRIPTNCSYEPPSLLTMSSPDYVLDKSNEIILSKTQEKNENNVFMSQSDAFCLSSSSTQSFEDSFPICPAMSNNSIDSGTFILSNEVNYLNESDSKLLNKVSKGHLKENVNNEYSMAKKHPNSINDEELTELPYYCYSNDDEKALTSLKFIYHHFFTCLLGEDPGQSSTLYVKVIWSFASNIILLSIFFWGFAISVLYCSSHKIFNVNVVIGDNKDIAVDGVNYTLLEMIFKLCEMKQGTGAAVIIIYALVVPLLQFIATLVCIIIYAFIHYKIYNFSHQLLHFNFFQNIVDLCEGKKFTCRETDVLSTSSLKRVYPQGEKPRIKSTSFNTYSSSRSFSSGTLCCNKAGNNNLNVPLLSNDSLYHSNNTHIPISSKFAPATSNCKNSYLASFFSLLFSFPKGKSGTKELKCKDASTFVNKKSEQHLLIAFNNSYCTLIKSINFLSKLMEVTEILSDWSMGDVFSIGLLTVYFSLNAAIQLKCHIPSDSNYSAFCIAMILGVCTFEINVFIQKISAEVNVWVKALFIFYRTFNMSSENKYSKAPSNFPISFDNYDLLKDNPVFKYPSKQLSSFNSFKILNFSSPFFFTTEINCYIDKCKRNLLEKKQRKSKEATMIDKKGITINKGQNSTEDEKSYVVSENVEYNNNKLTTKHLKNDTTEQVDSQTSCSYIRRRHEENENIPFDRIKGIDKNEHINQNKNYKNCMLNEKKRKYSGKIIEKDEIKYENTNLCNFNKDKKKHVEDYEETMTGKKIKETKKTRKKKNYERKCQKTLLVKLTETYYIYIQFFKLFLLFLILLLSHNSYNLPATINLDYINSLVAHYLPTVNTGLHVALPAIYGNCPKIIHTTPSYTCMGDKDIYYYKDNLYEAIGHWIYGVNTTHFFSIKINSTNDGISINLNGMIDTLKLSLQIGECVTPDTWINKKCDVIWNNDDSCCGEDIHFTCIIHATLRNESPFLKNIIVSNVFLSNLTIDETLVWKFRLQLMDITEQVIKNIKATMKYYLDSSHKYITWNNKRISAIDLLNNIIDLNAPYGFKFSN